MARFATIVGTGRHLPEIEVTNEALKERVSVVDPGLADAYAVRGLLESRMWQQTRLGTGNVEAEADFRRYFDDSCHRFVF